MPNQNIRFGSSCYMCLDGSSIHFHIILLLYEKMDATP